MSLACEDANSKLVEVVNVADIYMSHSQMLGKFEYGGGPIFKVVIEC